MTRRRWVRHDPPWYQVGDDTFLACFVVGIDEDVDAVCDVDVEVVLPDRSRWAATLVTVAEVQRLLATWSRTGHASGGRYFWYPDVVVVSEPGVDAMVDVVYELLGTPEFAEIFRRLPD